MKQFVRNICCFLIFVCLPSEASAAYTPEEIITVIEDIIEWKKQQEQLPEDGPLLQGAFLQKAGDTAGDWYPIGLGRIGYDDDYAAYRAVVSERITERYKQPGKLSDMKATEWHRISLALLATGGDPTAVNGINLIADGTYYRGHTAPLGAQGLNGLIWGLLTMDSMRYAIPDDAATSRAALIEEILASQLQDGGFSFYAEQADADITAMAIQALAPYYNGDEIFTYTQNTTGNTVTKTVRQVLDEALAALQTLQQPTAGFTSWGEHNVESAAQVLVALSALGIDVQQDHRFLQQDSSILDYIMSFQVESGGFAHTKQYNPDNPSSVPDEANTMASEQVLYALVAYYRFQQNYRTLYDFRQEQDVDLKARIQQLRLDIDALGEKPTAEELTTLMNLYLALPASEQSYVYNFPALAQAAQEAGLSFSLPRYTEAYNVHTNGKGALTPIIAQPVQPSVITTADIQKVSDLPLVATASQYVTVIALLEHFQQAPNASQHATEIAFLTQRKQESEEVQTEIDALNEIILAQLYPFHQLRLENRPLVEEVYTRFMALPEEDRQFILNAQQIEQSIAQLDRLLYRQVLIVGGVLITSFVLVGVFVYYRRRMNS